MKGTVNFLRYSSCSDRNIPEYACIHFKYLLIPFRILPQNKPQDNLFKFFFVCMYLSTMLAQLFINSFSGSRLMDTSEGITHAVYSSHWLERSQRCKRACLILVERTFHPIAIWAGGLVLLSLPTFVSVSHFSFAINRQNK